MRFPGGFFWRRPRLSPFQFSLWDSADQRASRGERRGFNSLYEILTFFWFVLWGKIAVSILFMRFAEYNADSINASVSFNSLYEIQAMSCLSIMTQHWFQFSLWDSVKQKKTLRQNSTSFNSLYEILTCTCGVGEAVGYVSILFMRFLRSVVRDGLGHRLFQFSLWDSSTNLWDPRSR